MATTIPKNRIIQSKGLGDTIGDIVESFNLDLSSNYGAIRITGSKRGSITVGGESVIDIPVGIVLFNNEYYFICEDYVFKGGNNPSEQFSVVENNLSISGAYSDIKIFNNKIYVSASTKLISSSDGSTWGDAVASGLTTTTSHLLEVFANRLYITDNNTKIFSINTSDTLSTSGAYTLNLNLEVGWVISTIKAIGNYIYIGLLNQNTGEGMVVTWDGATENTINSKINLPAGVVSSCVLENIHYIIDTDGSLKKYSGNSYTEVARLFKKKPYYFDGSWGKNNRRFVHPNGMQTTINGNILIFLSNLLENIDSYEDTIPSGIYEYDKNIGIYHKYSVQDTTCNGQHRIFNSGALCIQKPTAPDINENGSILFGAKYFTNTSSTKTGIFYEDTADTISKCAYFITPFLLSDTEETWQKIYTTYKKLKNTNDKIIIKYRTEEDEPTEATITWTDIDRFTTTTDISEYSIGDEVQVLQGNGSGKMAHITSITNNSGTYTVILDDNFGDSNIIPGTTAKALLSKWIKAGIIKYEERKQLRPTSTILKNTSPFIQFKIYMYLTGKNEVYKLKIISNQNIKE